MWVIVTKRIGYRVEYVQARRVRCEHCSTPYAFVWGGTFATQSTGLPLMSTDESLRRAALEKVFVRLRRVARDPEAGVGRCPSCHRPQRWMVRATYAHFFVVLGLSLGILGGGISLILAMARHAAVGAPTVWGAFIGVLLATAIGWVLAERELRAPTPDPRSLDDERLRGLFAQCRRENSDPVRVWWHQIVGKRAPSAGAMAVSLGVSDELGTLDVPAEWRTTAVLQEFSRERPLSSRRR